MKNQFLSTYVFLVLIIASSCSSEIKTSQNSKFSTSVARQPAEYDQQEAIWLMWSPIDHKEGYSNEQGA